MDITLERMLSFIPKKPDGKYVHGEKKKFCEKIDAPINIVSEWEAGKTKSYRNYVYATAACYNVSVEWLRGETDDPTPEAQKESSPQSGEHLDPVTRELMEFVETASEDERKAALEMVKLIKKQRWV